ncbi:hypothetical protein O163_08230 [Caldanaerobacter subterraneus subsp. yonseiensis KB-1]|uniref:Uncharacterized protein n=1 Tax=Caldanaerobacter subterraneus subsp. yonseiensis KB-1 TaxID=1388761 RepID=U5CG89_CALSX|nr:hypothetical protein [Caldanaerobacter subterraneus]ERM91925.1 hypothetical protein O163_08230 [Caldanaerobacter subterraneus subsp. yonseiensis KB-1]
MPKPTKKKKQTLDDKIRRWKKQAQEKEKELMKQGRNRQKGGKAKVKGK